MPSLDTPYADNRIIEAVLSKAERECPGALDMVAVYGSSGTADEYEKSDLDLMILINDERGWRLSDGFILDDTQVAMTYTAPHGKGWRAMPNAAMRI